MDNVIQYIGEHYKWIFSGVGVFIIGGIIAVFKNKKSSRINQSQKTGANSTNIQAGGNVEFTQKNDK